MEDYRSGTLAIVGPPNVGKSTLLNRLVGETLSIVTPMPQTTRHRILGIVHRPGVEIALFDTPGFHLPRTPLNRLMVEAIDSALEDADVVLLLVSAAGGRAPKARFGSPASELVDRVRAADVPAVLGLTKTDVVRPKERLLPLIEYAGTVMPFAAIVPISPLTGDGVEALVGEIGARMPRGERRWAEDELTDRPVRFLAGERIREALTIETREEVPHSTAVVVERYHEGGDGVRIAATIVVDRENHKRIMVGRGGVMVKRIGIRARRYLAETLGRPVHLSLVVRVQEGWSRDARQVRELTGE